MAKKYMVNIDLNNNKVVNSTSPSAGTDLANKDYVDGVARGLKWKEAVRARATGNVDISTLNNGDSLDGVTLATGDRVLLDNQSTAAQDGIYVVAASEGSTARAADLPAAANATGVAVTVTEGTANGDKVFIQTADPAIVGTDGLTFTPLGGGTTYTAGDGLSESPAGTFNVATGSGLEISSDTVRIAAAAAGAGLTGGAGSALAVGAGTGITVNADDVAINTSLTARWKSTAGTGTGTSYTFNHALGNQWVVGQCYEIATEEEVVVDVKNDDANNTVFTFAASQTLSNFRFTVAG